MSPMLLTEPEKRLTPREVIAVCTKAGMSRADAKLYYARLKRLEWWGNETYSATVDREAPHGFDSSWSVVHISLHRRDRAPVRDWRELQQIKTDILGPEVEAVELYPAETRVVDLANEFHLWAVVGTDGRPVRFPFGFAAGAQADTVNVPGAVQRPRDPSKRTGKPEHW